MSLESQVARLRLQLFAKPSNEAGPPGPPGPPGPGEVVDAADFDFATASPLILRALIPTDILNRVGLVIEVPFNDPAARIQIGTSANPSLLLDISAAVVAHYECSDFVTGTTDFLQLTITGSSTAGSGFLLFKLLP